MNPEDRPFSVNSVSDVGIDVTDEDLKKLADSFAKGREELQKKIDSLLLDMPVKPVTPLPEALQSKGKSLKVNKNIKIGIPITLPQATDLRELTVSSCVHSLSSEWKRAKFVFRGRDSELTYGLFSEKNGTKGLILCVQAVILKNMIVHSYEEASNTTMRTSRNEKIILRPSEIEKKNFLIKSISDILWSAGGKEFACVTINKGSACFSLDKGGRKGSYYVADGITEKLHLYDFNDQKSLTEFIKSNIGNFQKAEGCMLFVYSLIMSRRISKVRVDLQGQKLIGDMEECKIALFNLILTGLATPFFHNGEMHYDANGESLAKLQIGLKTRSPIGILYWDSKEDDKKRTEVGSMLKVPKYPIWLTIMGTNQLALIFNTNLSLISDWRFERNFNLNFYSPLLKQDTEYKINIDTREEYFNQKQVLQQKYTYMQFIEEEKEPEIEKIILTKWTGCLMSGTDDLMTLL